MKKSKKEYHKEYNLKNKERLKEQHKAYYLKNKEHLNKYSKEYSKDYYLKNKEHINKIAKEWCSKNKESISLRGRKHFLENKEHIYKRTNERKKIRRKNDPNYKLLSNLRTRLWGALKGNSKSASTMELIGCSIEELWKHLKSKFKSWMTKENYGLWHVDHIIPCASFDLTDPKQQKICFHWSNLQPLKAIDNIKKGTR